MPNSRRSLVVGFAQEELRMGRLFIRPRSVSRRPVLILAAILTLAMAIRLDAQAVKGSLLGNVSDEAGLPMPGATVTITETGTNITYTAVTNESGLYVFSNLKDGI